MPAAPRNALLLEAASLVPLAQLFPRLLAGLEAAGIWSEPVSGITPGAASLHLESSLEAMPSLYTALVRSGLELGLSTHTALAALCSFAHLAPPGNRDLRLDIRSLSAEQHLGSRRHAISA